MTRQTDRTSLCEGTGTQLPSTRTSQGRGQPPLWSERWGGGEGGGASLQSGPRLARDWAGSHGGAELRQISANQRQGRAARPLLPGAGEPRGWRFPALGGPRAALGGAEGESLGGGGKLVRGKPLTASLPRREAIIVEIRR